MKSCATFSKTTRNATTDLETRASFRVGILDFRIVRWVDEPAISFLDTNFSKGALQARKPRKCTKVIL